MYTTSETDVFRLMCLGETAVQKVCMLVIVLTCPCNDLANDGCHQDFHLATWYPVAMYTTNETDVFNGDSNTKNLPCV